MLYGVTVEEPGPSSAMKRSPVIRSKPMRQGLRRSQAQIDARFEKVLPHDVGPAGGG
jgi:hypothetical protein